MANFIDKLTIDELQNFISESTSVSEVLRKIGVTDRGSNHTKLVKYLKEHPEINTKTLVGRRIQRFNYKGTTKKKLSEVLIKNGTGNSNSLKKRLTNYDEKSPSFREGMNHHPYYFLQIY